MTKKYKPISENDDMSIYPVRDSFSDRAGLPAMPLIHKRKEYDSRARLMMSLVERWGMVAGMPDGEDSSGRQKLRLATPHELAERAFLAAHETFSLIDARGWSIPVPDINTISDAIKEQENGDND